ncbi:T9SS type A sorting domain-containing protein [Taibaiella sp. KBW10]|uniref:T9SS type A sorting domain-containing protein n=1 Tax=Taibaiella sp. KBW10 TaxID=2153357 RepID=UPI00131584A1|nr:T9SS type A sorting domain-containing protein [Taibaiella sp. KBW10]
MHIVKQKAVQFLVFLLLFSPGFNASAQSINTAEWVWAKHYGGAEEQITHRIKADASGNVYSFLQTSNAQVIAQNDTLTAGPYMSGGGFALLKHNRNGQLLFSKRIVLGTLQNAVSTYPLYAGDMAVDGNENIYVTGMFTGPTLKIGQNDSIVVPVSQANFYKQFIVKLNSAGTVVWKKYGQVTGIAGSQGSPAATHLSVDKDGDVYIFSQFSGYGGTMYGFDNFYLQATEQSGSNFYIAKFSSQNGQTQWLKNGFTGSTTSVEGLSVDKDKNLYLAMRGSGLDLNGTFYTIPNVSGVAGRILLKLNASGSFVWVKGMNAGPRFRDITNDKSGNVYITGNFYDTLKVSSPNDYIINNHYSSSSPNAGFILSYTPAGILRWSRVFYAMGVADASSAIAVDENLNSYVTMENYGTVYTGNDTIPVNTIHTPMVCVLKLDSSGAIAGHKNTGYTISASSRSFTTAVDLAGNVYTGGEFRTEPTNPLTTFNIGNSSFHAIEAQDAFIAKLKVAPLVSFDTISKTVWCPSDSVKVPFRYNNTLFSSATNFALELSSVTGSFSTPSFVTTLPFSNTGLDTFKFVLPSSLAAGSTYKLRIKAALPNATTLPYDTTVTIASLPPVPVITQAAGLLSCSLTGYTYQWYKDNALLPGATGQTYAPTASGTYKVKVSNAAGCFNMSTGFLYSATGIKESIGADEVDIFPNPVLTYLTINIKRNMNHASYTISDVQGRILNKGSLQSGKNKVYVKDLSAGIYWLKIQNDTRSAIYKVIRQD